MHVLRTEPVAERLLVFSVGQERFKVGPNLIQNFRLERGAQLLGKQWGPVSQVAFEVGFSNPSYFSKRFKEKFGVSPSEYPHNA